MEKDSKITINKNTKIIVPGTSYDFKSDHRLLIPFTQEDKIGFINQGGDVVVEAKYNMYYGECYKPSDLIRVTVPFIHTAFSVAVTRLQSILRICKAWLIIKVKS